MQAVAEYIRALAVFMIFSALVGIIAPSSSFRKYINVVLGLMLIAFMLEPLVNAINHTDGFLSQAYNKYEYALETKAVKETGGYESENGRLIIAEYKNRLCKQMTTLIEENTGAYVENCGVIVNEDYSSDSFAELYGMHMTVTANSPETGMSKLAFGGQNALSSEQIKTVTEQIIKKHLTDFYNIDEGNIHITVL